MKSDKGTTVDVRKKLYIPISTFEDVGFFMWYNKCWYTFREVRIPKNHDFCFKNQHDLQLKIIRFIE